MITNNHLEDDPEAFCQLLQKVGEELTLAVMRNPTEVELDSLKNRKLHTSLMMLSVL
ncbi:hypothetical protein L4D76_10725 [Photobacterium sagamiensis]|uniref:hypothetical protein n=1 Tax=Photobacterium sagamiensis TaxID=2910241 RepID=UPI003D0DBE89